MAPRHHEIVKPIGEGFSLRWDATDVEPGRLRQIDVVAKERSSLLRAIVEGTGPDAAIDEPIAERGDS